MKRINTKIKFPPRRKRTGPTSDDPFHRNELFIYLVTVVFHRYFTNTKKSTGTRFKSHGQSRHSPRCSNPKRIAISKAKFRNRGETARNESSNRPIDDQDRLNETDRFNIDSFSFVSNKRAINVAQRGELTSLRGWFPISCTGLDYFLQRKRKRTSS